MAEILYDKVADYKTYILSLLVFKRLSDNWAWEINNKVRQFAADHGKEPNPRPPPAYPGLGVAFVRASSQLRKATTDGVARSAPRHTK